jgi:hypothetical protein
VNNQDVFTVHSLVGAKQAPLAAQCFGSLLAAVRRPIRLAIHDDSTLDAPARETLAAQLGAACTFVDRAEATALVGERLRLFPRCARFRATHLFGQKLFDVPLLATGRVVYADTDILWTRACDIPAYFAGAAENFSFMRDLRESYAVSLRLWPILQRSGIRLASRLCAGMISFAPSAYDLDYIEWLLGVDERYNLFGGFRFWAEQTIYAALAARGSRAWIDPAECVVAHRRNFARTRDAAVIHFAGFARPLFAARFAALDLAGLTAQPPRTLGTIPAPLCGLGRRVYSALRTRTLLRDRV